MGMEKIYVLLCFLVVQSSITFLMKDTRYQASVWMAIFPFFTLFEMDIFSFAGKISHKFPSDVYISTIYKRIGFFSVLNLCVRLCVCPSVQYPIG
jgi:hypothetical protein